MSSLRIDNITLLESAFKTVQLLSPFEMENPIIEISIKDLNQTVIEEDENKSYVQRFFVAFSLICIQNKEVCFTVESSYGVTYIAQEQKDLDLIKREIMVSHVIPYFRHYVSTVTAASIFPTIFFPPTNTITLIEKYEKKMTKNRILSIAKKTKAKQSKS